MAEASPDGIQLVLKELHLLVQAALLGQDGGLAGQERTVGPQLPGGQCPHQHFPQGPLAPRHVLLQLPGVLLLPLQEPQPLQQTGLLLRVCLGSRASQGPVHASQATAQQQQEAKHPLQVGHEPAEPLQLAGGTGLAHRGLQGSPAPGPGPGRPLQLLLLRLKAPQHLLEEVRQLRFLSVDAARLRQTLATWPVRHRVRGEGFRPRFFLRSWQDPGGARLRNASSLLAGPAAGWSHGGPDLG